MKIKKSTLIIIDIMCVALLVGLIYVAIQRKKQPRDQRQYPQTGKRSLEVHEVDKTVMHQIEALHEQIDTMLHLAIHDDMDSATRERLKDLGQKIREIEKKYTHTSPALSLLGPIGTTSIVLKERQLANQLLNITNQIGHLLHDILYGSSEHTSHAKATSIEASIAKNAQLIKKLLESDRPILPYHLNKMPSK